MPLRLIISKTGMFIFTTPKWIAVKLSRFFADTQYISLIYLHFHELSLKSLVFVGSFVSSCGLNLPSFRNERRKGSRQEASTGHLPSAKSDRRASSVIRSRRSCRSRDTFIQLEFQVFSSLGVGRAEGLACSGNGKNAELFKNSHLGQVRRQLPHSRFLTLPFGLGFAASLRELVMRRRFKPEGGSFWLSFPFIDKAYSNNSVKWIQLYLQIKTLIFEWFP